MSQILRGYSAYAIGHLAGELARQAGFAANRNYKTDRGLNGLIRKRLAGSAWNLELKRTLEIEKSEGVMVMKFLFDGEKSSLAAERYIAISVNHVREVLTMVSVDGTDHAAKVAPSLLEACEDVIMREIAVAMIVGCKARAEAVIEEERERYRLSRSRTRRNVTAKEADDGGR